MNNLDSEDKEQNITPSKKWDSNEKDSDIFDSDLEWLNEPEENSKNFSEQDTVAGKNSSKTPSDNATSTQPSTQSIDDLDWLTTDTLPEPTLNPINNAATPKTVNSEISNTPAMKKNLAKAISTPKPGDNYELPPTATTMEKQSSDQATTNTSADNGWLTDDSEANTGSAPTPFATSTSSETLLTDHQIAENHPSRRKSLLWPIITVFVALILVAIGGWGIFTEQSKLKVQIIDLTNQLAHRQQQGDLSPEEEQALQSDNRSLRLQLATLREQYTNITTELDGLKQQHLSAQVKSSGEHDEATHKKTETITTNTAISTITSVPKQVEKQVLNSTKLKLSPINTAKNTAKTTTNQEIVTADVVTIPKSNKPGQWFINIASYSHKSTASGWVNKINNDLPNPIALQEIEANGNQLYRIRALNFTNETEAKKAAKILEIKYNIGPLWVGKSQEAP